MRSNFLIMALLFLGVTASADEICVQLASNVGANSPLLLLENNPVHLSQALLRIQELVTKLDTGSLAAKAQAIREVGSARFKFEEQVWGKNWDLVGQKAQAIALDQAITKPFFSLAKQLRRATTVDSQKLIANAMASYLNDNLSSLLAWKLGLLGKMGTHEIDMLTQAGTFTSVPDLVVNAPRELERLMDDRRVFDEAKTILFQAYREVPKRDSYRQEFRTQAELREENQAQVRAARAESLQYWPEARLRISELKAISDSTKDLRQGYSTLADYAKKFGYYKTRLKELVESSMESKSNFIGREVLFEYKLNDYTASDGHSIDLKKIPGFVINGVVEDESPVNFVILDQKGEKHVFNLLDLNSSWDHLTGQVFFAKDVLHLESTTYGAAKSMLAAAEEKFLTKGIEGKQQVMELLSQQKWDVASWIPAESLNDYRVTAPIAAEMKKPVELLVNFIENSDDVALQFQAMKTLETFANQVPFVRGAVVNALYFPIQDNPLIVEEVRKEAFSILHRNRETWKITYEGFETVKFIPNKKLPLNWEGHDRYWNKLDQSSFRLKKPRGRFNLAKYAQKNGYLEFDPLYLMSSKMNEDAARISRSGDGGRGMLMWNDHDRLLIDLEDARGNSHLVEGEFEGANRSIMLTNEGGLWEIYDRYAKIRKIYVKRFPKDVAKPELPWPTLQ